jgi:hypothetical protein
LLYVPVIREPIIIKGKNDAKNQKEKELAKEKRALP